MKKIGALIAALAMAGAAHAEGYAGVAIGEGSVDIDTGDTGYADESSTSLRLFGGAGYFEAGYIDFGEAGAHYPADDGSETYDASAFYVALRGGVEVGGAEFYAKAGLARWDLDYSVEFFTTGYGYQFGGGSGNGVDPMFGIGARIPVTESASVELGFERFMDVGDGVGAETQDLYTTLDGGDVDVISAGIVIRL